MTDFLYNQHRYKHRHVLSMDTKLKIDHQMKTDKKNPKVRPVKLSVTPSSQAL